MVIRITESMHDSAFLDPRIFAGRDWQNSTYPNNQR